MNHRAIAVAAAAIMLLSAAPASPASANPERHTLQQKITVNGTPATRRMMSPSVRGALDTLDRRLAKDGMSISDYEKIEIGTTRNYILVAATNLSKLKQKPFDYIRAVTSIEYAFQAVLHEKTLEIMLLRSPEGMEFD